MSLGPTEVPVWQKQDLLQGWPGGLPGEAAFGQTAFRLCRHPEDNPLLARPQKVSEDERVCHHDSEACTGSAGTQVGGSFTTGREVQTHVRSVFLMRLFFVSPFSCVKFLRQTKAAIVIQRNVRMWSKKRRFLQQRSAAVTVQRVWRGCLARKHYFKVNSRLILFIILWSEELHYFDYLTQWCANLLHCEPELPYSFSFKMLHNFIVTFSL